MSDIKLINDDAIKVLKEMESESINLIISDPPYRTTPRGSCGTMGGFWKTNLSAKGKIFKHNDIKCKDYFGELFRVLKDKSILYIMCNNTNLIEMLNEGVKVGFNFVKSLIWNKGNKICGRYYMNCFEYILLFRKGGDRPINNCGTPDILNVPIHKAKNSNGKNLHDTEKPKDLWKILIENSSNEGDTVLDPFMGIGNDILACKELNRNFVGIEIEKEYFDICNSKSTGENWLAQQTIDNLIMNFDKNKNG